MLSGFIGRSQSAICIMTARTSFPVAALKSSPASKSEPQCALLQVGKGGERVCSAPPS